MIRFIRTFFNILLLIFPLLGICHTVSVKLPQSANVAVVTQEGICSGNSILLQGDEQPLLLDNYIWQVLKDNTWVSAPGTNNQKNYTTPVLNNGTTAAIVFNYRRQVTGPDGSIYDSYYDITVTPQPGITSNSISICSGTSGTITANTDDANATITWYASNTSTTPLATGKNFTTPVLSHNAIYYAEAVDNMSGCTSATRSAATVTLLKQLDAPVVTVTSTTSSTITIAWGAVDGATGYQVSTDGGQSFTPTSGEGLSYTISGLQQGQSVTIIVEATGTSDCQTSSSSTAVTALAYNPVHDLIYVANTFTPNGDGVNDVIYVHSNSIKSMNFYVYDQWGEMLFKSASQSVGWDGTYKGRLQPVGVYVYYLEALMSDGQKVNKKGTITLLK